MHGEKGDIKCLTWYSLRQEFLLVSTDGLSTLNPKTLVTELIRASKTGSKYSLCAAFGSSLFLIINGVHVQRRTIPGWMISDEWNDVVKNECGIVSIVMNHKHVAFIVTQKGPRANRVELRDYYMDVIRTLETYTDNVYEFSSLLKNGDWIIGENSYSGRYQILNLQVGLTLMEKKESFNYENRIKQLLVLDDKSLVVQYSDRLAIIDS